MPIDMFSALVAFAAAMAFTPGPNNIMVTASGVNFGFARTIPHILGITFGFFVLVSVCAAGLGAAFAAYPPLQVALKVAGALYLLWLAWKIATSAPASDDEPQVAEPISFWQAALFQWLNPKALVAALSGVALYVRPAHWVADFTVLQIVYTVATILAVATWTGFGVALRRVLADPKHARIFNFAMALLLVASIVPMVI
ncbi:LysE family translocator [Pseudorhodoplanes sp.]|uniref:LysE family translocator n=1 Tax=Pseudorhodoplanes sp. TaxID=1934341 RepID=UPI002B9389E0|nr:LysE family translocator [Pseudorhodoplanes sp.]HWV41502.1 LysE family translocator [Pseudorhodoplanes sp.]